MSQNDLSWISFDRLVQIAQTRFAAAYQKARGIAQSSLAVEPTLALARSFIVGSPLDTYREADEVVAVTKTLQNAVGLFHQDVLSSVEGWVPMGTTGGVLDVRSSNPIQLARGRHVLIEVKMRHNTIKASDEKGLWDKLEGAVKVYGGSRENVGYIIQIVPKHQAAYDRPWKVSGRSELEYVRAADGVTGYHLVTGEPSALFDLLRLMPDVLEAAMPEIAGKSWIRSRSPSEALVLDGLLLQSLPRNSALTSVEPISESQQLTNS